MPRILSSMMSPLCLACCPGRRRRVRRGRQPGARLQPLGARAGLVRAARGLGPPAPRRHRQRLPVLPPGVPLRLQDVAEALAALQPGTRRPAALGLCLCVCVCLTGHGVFTAEFRLARLAALRVRAVLERLQGAPGQPLADPPGPQRPRVHGFAHPQRPAALHYATAASGKGKKKQAFRRVSTRGCFDMSHLWFLVLEDQGPVLSCQGYSRNSPVGSLATRGLTARNTPRGGEGTQKEAAKLTRGSRGSRCFHFLQRLGSPACRCVCLRACACLAHAAWLLVPARLLHD